MERYSKIIINYRDQLSIAHVCWSSNFAEDSTNFNAAT